MAIRSPGRTVGLAYRLKANEQVSANKSGFGIKGMGVDSSKKPLSSRTKVFGKQLNED